MWARWFLLPLSAVVFISCGEGESASESTETAEEDSVTSTLEYSATEFSETTDNDGSIDTSITVTLADDEFVNEAFVLDTHYSLSEDAVPSGLSLNFSRSSATQMTISLTGNADDHTPADNLTSLTINFLAEAFVSGELPSTATKSETFALSFTANTIVIFATGRFDGDLGGRSGADAKCNAAKPGAVAQSNVRAFLSVTGTDEIRDMPGNYAIATDEVVRTPDDTLIANDWADLTDDSFQASLQSGGVATAHSEAWTGSTAAGALQGDHCTNWTNNAFGNGWTGRTDLTTSTLAGSGDPCDLGSKHILCLAYY